MKIGKSKKLAAASLFAALVCVASSVVQIPSPASGGFFNLGDCFVIASALLLSRSYAAAGAGIGSALADIITGHAAYAPASFIIKAFMAFTANTIYGKSKKKMISKAVSAIVSEVIMCAGYFVYEALIFRLGAAASANLIANIIQGVSGAVLSVILVTALEKTGITEE